MNLLNSIHLYPPQHTCGAEFMAHWINKDIKANGGDVRVLLHQAAHYRINSMYTYDGVVDDLVDDCASFRDIMRHVLMNNPKSILDLGIGHGINGAGIRNWLNVGVKSNYKDTTVIGVEGFKDYESPLWGCYDIVQSV